MTSQNYIGTIGYIKGNLMGSSALTDKGYTNENFYPGASNIPDSNPVRPEGMPPVTDGLLLCLDGNIGNDWKNLVSNSPMTYTLNYIVNRNLQYHNNNCIQFADSSTSFDYGIKLHYKSPQTGYAYEVKQGGRTQICIAAVSIGGSNTSAQIIDGYTANRNAGATYGDAHAISADLSLHFSGVGTSDFRAFYNGGCHIGTNQGAVRYLPDAASTYKIPTIYGVRYNAYLKEEDAAITCYNDTYVNINQTVCTGINLEKNVDSTKMPKLGFGNMIGCSKYHPGINTYVYAVYVYDRCLSDAEMNKVVNYAANRYNIKL